MNQSQQPMAHHASHRKLGRTGLSIPPVVFGTTCLGNLFVEMADDAKQELVQAWMKKMPSPVAIDSAGKYGAGMALEVLSRELQSLQVNPDDVVISNKLAWRRTPLTTADPTFEPGVWVGLKHDAVQDISYEGILRCHRDGCEMLAPYTPKLVSVHDPDEYLAAAVDEEDRALRKENILGAYRALEELREAGEIKGVGVGAKDWRIIKELDQVCSFDWVMMANSFTILNHPPELISFLDNLKNKQIGLINSAVMHGGFLSGGNFFDYRQIDPLIPEDAMRLQWRDEFTECCSRHQTSPFLASVAFGRSHPAVTSVALSTSRPERVDSLIEASTHQPSSTFWKELVERELIASDYPYLS
ncbi:aldo/keto reductase [bacterium]|nr:aldo/keto reductase [bacterium]